MTMDVPKAEDAEHNGARESKSEGLQRGGEQAAPQRQLRGIPWILVVLSILTSTFLFGLDNTIVADVQPAIVSQFGSVDKLAWLSVAFLFSAASTTLFWSADTGTTASGAPR